MRTKRENSLEKKLATSERKHNETKQTLALTRQELSEVKSQLRYKKQRVGELTASRDTHASNEKEYKVQSEELSDELAKIKKKDFWMFPLPLLTVISFRN
jgi:chromosome segregation ATPase